MQLKIFTVGLLSFLLLNFSIFAENLLYLNSSQKSNISYYTDANGIPVHVKTAFSKGNLHKIKRSFYSKTKKKPYPSELGFVNSIYITKKKNEVRVEQYNKEKILVSFNQFKISNKDIVITDHFLSLFRTRKFDLEGQITREEIRDIQGNPSQGGVAFINYKYNQNGNLIYQDHRDYNNNLTSDSAGVAVYRYKYNSEGHLVYEKKFAKDKKLIPAGSFYAYIVNSYNNSGELIQEEYYSTNNKIVQRDKEFSKVVYQYDNSYLLKYEYLDSNNKAVNNRSGIHQYIYKYDLSGNLIHRAFFNKEKLPVKDPLGFYSYSYNYDDEGNLLQEIKYRNSVEEKDNSIVDVSKFVYDNEGNLVSEHHFIHPKKVVSKSNFYCRLDILQKEQYVILPSQEPSDCIISDQASSARYTYNSNHNITDAYYYIDKELLLSFHYKYDENGTLVSTSYLNKDGNPTYIMGISPCKFIYIKGGKLILSSCMADRRNDSCEKYSYYYQYDSQNRMVSKEYFNSQNRLIPRGIARVIYKYKDDKIFSISYYNNSNEPERDSFSTHKIINQYDTEGRKKQVARYNTSSELLRVKEYSYNLENQKISEEEFDSKGSLLNAQYYYYVHWGKHKQMKITYNQNYDIIDIDLDR